MISATTTPAIGATAAVVANGACVLCRWRIDIHIGVGLRAGQRVSARGSWNAKGRGCPLPPPLACDLSRIAEKPQGQQDEEGNAANDDTSDGASCKVC